MARWDERIEDNEARQQLDALETELKALEEKAATEAVNPFLTRFRRVLSGIRERFEVPDPAMVGHQMLEDVSSVVQNVRNTLNGSMADLAVGDQAALDTLDTRFDELVTVVARYWPPPPPAREAQRLRRAVTEVEEAARRFEERQAERIRAAQDREAQVQAQTAEALQKATAAVEGLERRVAELEGTIATDAQRLQEAITSFQGTFDTQQQERTNQFAALLKEEREQAAATIEESREAFGIQKEQVDTRFSETLKTLQGHLDKAEEIMGAIGATGMTAGYDKYGTNEDESFRTWRRVAVVMGALAAIGLAVLVVLDHSQTLTTPDVSKIALTAAFAGLASYCARQAGAHRRTARHMRTMALAIASLGPYLQSLEPASREEVLKNFAYFFFSRQLDADHEADDFRHGENFARTFMSRYVNQSPKP